MNITQIDRIRAAYERTGLCKGIPQAQRIAATAKALGITEEMVREAIERQEEEA